MNKKVLLIIIAILLVSAIAILSMFLFFNKKDNDDKAELKIEDSASNILRNDYQVSFYRSGKGTFKLILDEKEISSIDDPEAETTSFLLPVNSGEHLLEIQIIPGNTGQKLTYAYDLYEFPKEGSSQYQVFDDKYKIASSKKPDDITGLIRAKENTKIQIPFIAK